MFLNDYKNIIVNLFGVQGGDVTLQAPKVDLGANVAPRGGANLSLGAPSINLQASAPQAQVKLSPPAAQLGAAAPKAEFDVRAPTANVRGPKMDVGAKVGGFLEGVGADIGGLFKAPKAEVNVQAPKLETGGSVSLGAKAPALDVSASAPKPQVQMGAPQVNVQGPQLVCLMHIRVSYLRDTLVDKELIKFAYHTCFLCELFSGCWR